MSSPDAETGGIVLNLGSGEEGAALPEYFRGWREIRVDVDPETRPDLLTSITDLGAIPSTTVQAVWASHCLEHLYQHEVSGCLLEAARVLADEGFLLIRVPDLQAVAQVIAEDRLHDVLYNSRRGPVSAHDVLFGFGADVAAGRVAMAHRTGFTPKALLDALQKVFPRIFIRRTNRLELIAVARKEPWSSDHEPSELLAALGL